MAVLDAPIPLRRRPALVTVEEAAPRERRAPYLFHPQLDTWLVGGLSLVVFVVVAALWPLSNVSPSIGTQLRNLALIAPTLALFINYPHFLASYRLAYWRRDAGLRHSFTLVFVPLLLVIATLLSYATFNQRLTIAGHTVEHFGARLAGWMIGFMFLTVGWHYVKQAYGCARVGARLRGFSMSSVQARALRYSMFPLWLSIWARANASRGTFDYVGVHYGSLELPRWIIPVTNFAIIGGVVCALATCLSMARRNGQRPPLLFVVPVVAMFVWWIPAAYNPTFFVLVPMFHSLQYLPFAAKVEHGRAAARYPEKRSLRRRLVVTWLAIGAAGWLAFELLPNAADRMFRSDGRLGLAFFFAMIPALINIHHYFIDHVIWRPGEPEVFAHLTAAPAPGA
jgi:hypothetical protein